MIAEKNRPRIRFNMKKVNYMLILVFLISLCIDVVAVWGSVERGIATANDVYKDSMMSQKTSTYDRFKEAAYSIAEKQNHVSNDVSIQINGIMQTSKLHVLKISGTVYIPNRNSENSVWLKVDGTGDFTVDLGAAEYVVDNSRHYVLVRVPEPVLEEQSIAIERKTPLYLEDNVLKNGSVRDGERFVIEASAEAKQEIKKDFDADQQFSEFAKKRAEAIIRTDIIALNPDVSDIVVNVEFYS